MAKADEPAELPLSRYQRALGAMIALHKTAVIRLHADASKLTGRQAKSLRKVADEMDEYAEHLRGYLNELEA